MPLTTAVDSGPFNELASGLTDMLTTSGYQHQKMYWRYYSPETVAVCHLHHYGFIVEIEIGAHVPCLSSTAVRRPTAKHLHAVTPLSQLVRVSSAANNRIVLEQGQAVGNAAAVRKALKAFADVGVPVLSELHTLAGLRRTLAKYGTRRWATSPELRQLLFGQDVVLDGDFPA